MMSDKSQEHDKNTQEHDENTQEHDRNMPERDENTQEHDENTQEQDENTQEHDENTQEHDKNMPEHDEITQEHDENIEEDNVNTLDHDELVNALLDSGVIDTLADKLVARLAPMLTAMFENAFNKVAESLSLKMEAMVDGVGSKPVTDSNKAIDQRMSPLEEEKQKISLFEEERRQLKQRIKRSEISVRSNNLVIYGLVETPPKSSEREEPNPKLDLQQANHSAFQDVLNFCVHRLHLTIHDADISFAYRLATTKGSTTPRPLVVGFTSRRARELVYAARRSLYDPHVHRSKLIYINEHLTRENSLIYARTRSLVKERKIKSTWTTGGHVLIRQLLSLHDKPIKINSIQHLESLISPSPPPLPFASGTT